MVCWNIVQTTLWKQGGVVKLPGYRKKWLLDWMLWIGNSWARLNPVRGTDDPKLYPKTDKKGHEKRKNDDARQLVLFH